MSVLLTSGGRCVVCYPNGAGDAVTMMSVVRDLRTTLTAALLIWRGIFAFRRTKEVKVHALGVHLHGQSCMYMQCANHQCCICMSPFHWCASRSKRQAVHKAQFLSIGRYLQIYVAFCTSHIFLFI